MKVLAGLEPTVVFDYFEQICSIPHGSNNTKAISDYCVAFAKEHQLRYRQDKSNNVIIDSVSTKRNIAVVFHQFVPEEIKTLDECKGMATSDFQSYLEKQWIRDLRNKYEYKVCQEVYDSIK